MQKLIALTALYILGQWLQPGAEVPSDVLGFDYAKAYRKGMLEADDGSEVENPLPPGQLAPASPAAQPSPGSDESSLRTQATQLTRECDEAQRQASGLQERLEKAVSGLKLAQDALEPWEGLDPVQVQADRSALTEYREVLGELLPAPFPGRAKLFTQGYYTTAMLDGMEKTDLVALEGIGEVTADQILKALPASATTPQG